MVPLTWQLIDESSMLSGLPQSLKLQMDLVIHQAIFLRLPLFQRLQQEEVLLLLLLLLPAAAAAPPPPSDGTKRMLHRYRQCRYLERRKDAAASDLCWRRS